MSKPKKPFIYKRIIAYAVDIFIVSMIASIITLAFPKNDIYEEKVKELSTITEKYQKKEINESEYTSSYEDISYELNKSSIETTIVIVAISLLYYVLLNYYNDGMTIGKKVMKLKIVSASDKALHINNYLLRTLIVNSVLANIVSITLIELLSKENYILYNSKISIVFSIIYVVCFVFIIYRADGRGLHDLLCNTKVVSTKIEFINEKVEKEENKVIEADYQEKSKKRSKNKE